MAGTSADTEPNDFDRKKRKAEKKLAKALKKAAANASENEGAPIAAADQTKKKKKKKQSISQDAAVQNAPQTAAELQLPQTNGIETATLDPAKSTKSKKRKLAEEQSAEPADQVANEAEEPPAELKKKKKKQKNAQTSSQAEAVLAITEEDSAQAPHARIGNAVTANEGRPLQKNLYKQGAEVSEMSEAVVKAWLDERQIVVVGSSLRPILQFSQSGLPTSMLHATRTFVSPSPIQGQCIPIALSGRDLIGIAATGSGKTIAFGLPCLQHIQAQREAGVQAGKAPRALMLSPTRELAQQIAAVMEEAGEKCGVKALCVYGGVPKVPQAKQLKKGVDIVVATPGRLEDLMNDNACQVEQVSYLVLDEADRMLDLGFEPHIRAIAGKTRADRQTLMFSATWPTEVQKLAMDYMSNPARVVIGSQDLSASHSVKQIVEVIEPEAREKRLLELLKKYHGSRKNRVLVFVLYKKEASRVEEKLQRAGWKAASIHGDISQAQRSKAVEQFKSGAMPLLIATDVAARGLDIPDVEAVINYSFPLTTEDYVHRIGRTGRAGKSGLAHTFFSGATDKARSGELINVLREAGQPVPDDLLKFGVTTKKKESKMYGAHFKEIDHSKKATKITFDD